MKILLVEDDDAIARIVVRVLSSEGHNLSWESDGNAGLAIAMSGGFDCLVLDWMLPGKSGVEICQELRRRGNSIPILMLTAKSESPNVVTGLDSGADDYLKKPFELDELTARVRALSRREAVNRSGITRIGKLEINDRLQSAIAGGVELSLTRQEYLLIEALAKYQGRTLSREFILASIWNAEETLTNSVDVHVSSLRRKLGSSKGLPVIRTVHREGYRLVNEVEGEQ